MPPIADELEPVPVSEKQSVPPVPPQSASVHDVVDHFMRFTPRDDATDLEYFTYYEAYVAALESAHERGTGLMSSAFVKRWYHDLHDALLRCLERHRPGCKENEWREQFRSALERPKAEP